MMTAQMAYWWCTRRYPAHNLLDLLAWPDVAEHFGVDRLAPQSLKQWAALRQRRLQGEAA